MVQPWQASQGSLAAKGVHVPSWLFGTEAAARPRGRAWRPRGKFRPQAADWEPQKSTAEDRKCGQLFSVEREGGDLTLPAFLEVANRKLPFDRLCPLGPGGEGDSLDDFK